MKVISGRGKDGRDTHLDNLFDARLAGLCAAGDDQGPNLLAGIMRSPEANERAVAKGEIDDIFGPDAEAPDTIAPHFVDPVPVLHAIQYTDGGTPGGARSEVIANSILCIGGEQITKQGLFQQGFHPLFPGHKGNAAEIIQGFDLLGFEASRVKLAPVAWSGGIRPLT